MRDLNLIDTMTLKVQTDEDGTQYVNTWEVMSRIDHDGPWMRLRTFVILSDAQNYVIDQNPIWGARVQYDIVPVRNIIGKAH